MECLIIGERSTISELQLELGASKAAANFTEGKVKWMEARFAMSQVKLIHEMLKASLTTY